MNVKVDYRRIVYSNLGGEAKAGTEATLRAQEGTVFIAPAYDPRGGKVHTNIGIRKGDDSTFVNLSVDELDQLTKDLQRARSGLFFFEYPKPVTAPPPEEPWYEVASGNDKASGKPFKILMQR